MHEDLDVEMFEDPLKLDGTEMNAGRRLSKYGTRQQPSDAVTSNVVLPCAALVDLR